MAEESPNTKQQRVASSTAAQNKKNPSEFYSHFLLKTLIIAIFLVTIPFFPSESPDYSTRGWELLHLVFVGIAVSYGLFSRRNDGDSERENNSKFDGAQSYMSRLLQFPSIFDDEADSPSGSDDNSSSDKIQTWSSRYHRNEPLLVVAKKSPVNVQKSGIDEKPLLLPVRSLRFRVSDGNDVDLVDAADSRVCARSNSMPVSKGLSNGSKRMNRIDGEFVSRENSGASRACARSNSSASAKGISNDSRRMSKNRNLKSRPVVASEFGGVDENTGVSGSLSRSNSASSSSSSSGTSSSSRRYSSYSTKASSAKYANFDGEEMEEQEEKVEETVVLPSPIPWRSRSGKIEMKGESNGSASFSFFPSMQEIEPTRSFKSQSQQSSQSSSSSSSPTKRAPSPSVSSTRKVSPSTTSSSESQAKSGEDVGRRRVVYSSCLPPPPPPPPPPRPRRIPKSRGVWSASYDMGKESREESFNRANAVSEAKARNGVESSSVANSSKTVRADEIITGARNISEVEEEPGRKSIGYSPMSKASLSEFPKETRDFLEEVLVETDYDSESEDADNYEESKERVDNRKLEEVPSNSITDEGSDVDRKADEFIAKFREQIRLQRIESIKRSVGQLKRSSVM